MTPIVADENVDSGIIRALQGLCDVYSVSEEERGASDERVMEICRLRKAILLTADKDFGEYVFRFRRVSTGVVLCRLSDIDQETRAKRVAAAISAHGHEMIGRFTVITRKQIRIRTLGA